MAKRVTTYTNQRKGSVAAGSEVGGGGGVEKLEESGKYSSGVFSTVAGNTC